MKRTNRVFLITLLSLFICFLTESTHAQLGYIKIGSKILNDGDTFYVCKGNCINYQSFPTVSGSVRWKFKNATNTTSGFGNTVSNICYNTVGTDSTVKIVNTINGPDSIHIIIVVSDVLPPNGFTFTPDNICGNDTVRFNTSFTPTAGLSFNWLFGDGGTSNLVNPTHQYLNAIGASGTTNYTINQVVTNTLGCSSQATGNIQIVNIPDATLTSGNTIADVQFLSSFNGFPTFRRCSPLGNTFNFIFINQSTTSAINTNYDIDWGDGSPHTILNASWTAGNSVTHTYSRGYYFLTVKATGINSCIGIKKYLIFYGLGPTGALGADPVNDRCIGETFSFPLALTDGNSPATIYTFEFDDGTDPVVYTHPPPNPITHQVNISSCGFTCPPVPNSFCARLRISNACSVNPTPFTIGNLLVSGKPKAKMRIPQTGPVCTGTPINIQNISLYGGVSTGDCSNTGVQVWTITPATGFTTTPASLGLLNGQPADGNVWTNGPSSFIVNFNTPGTYTIKLYISNFRCGIDSTTRTICVRNPPMATFTKNRDSSCGPGSAIFTNTSGTGGCNGDIYKWNVRFEDPLGCSSNITPEYEFINGTRDTSANPEIRFNKPGRFIITLTTSAKDATASGCPTATSPPDTFIVKGPPKIPPLNPGTICPNDSINLNITPTACYSPGPLSCSWTFTNGTPANSNNCTPGPVIYNTLGNHPITLTVTDASCNLSTTVTDTVRVINAPAANAGPDTTFCSGDTIQIGPAPQPGVTYQWTPAAGLSNPNIANPLISLTYNGPNNADTISYTLEVSGGPGCKGRDTVIIIVKRKPLVTINPGAATLCRDSSVTLTATGANSYSWVPGGAVTPTITVTPPVTTNYIVTGILAATGCSAIDTAVITVTNKARAEFTLSDSVYCVDVHLNTAVSVNHYPALNQLYTWYINGVPNNPNTTGAPPDSVITTPGAFFNIKLVTTSMAGCAPDSLQSTFRTKPSVTAAFSKSGSSGCGPYLVTFTNLTSPPSSFAVYYWDFGNLTTSTQFQPGPQTFLSSPSFNDTTYYITLKVYDGCDTTQYLDSVKVFPKPSARFSVSPTTGCSPFAVQFINNSLGNNTA